MLQRWIGKGREEEGGELPAMAKTNTTSMIWTTKNLGELQGTYGNYGNNKELSVRMVIGYEAQMENAIAHTQMTSNAKSSSAGSVCITEKIGQYYEQ